jgi:integrase
MPRPSTKPWYRRGRGWYVEWGGRQICLARGPRDAATRKVAEQKFHALMIERAANPTVDGGDPTVASVIDAFLDYDVRRSGQRTYYERRRYLQLFAEALGRKSVKACLPYDLTRWLDAHPEWESEWTKSYAVRCVHRPFNWAVKSGLIPKNPFAGVTQAVGEPRRPMTSEEFTRLVRALGPWRGLSEKVRSSRIRFLEILIFLRYTGARPSELRNLRWADVDLDRAEIVLWRHKTTRTQRQRTPRRIPLVPRVARLLTRIRRRGEGDGNVFLTHRGTPWARYSIAQRLKRLRTRAGVPDDVTLYGLRHEFGTQAILNGVDLKTLAELMGHTTTRTTEHYLHVAGRFNHLHDSMRRATARRPGA